MDANGLKHQFTAQQYEQSQILPVKNVTKSKKITNRVFGLENEIEYNVTAF